MGIVEDTTKKFHPPISLPTFLLGALLILVGLTAELNVWEFKKIVPDPTRTSNPGTTLNEKELYEHFNMDGSEMYYRLEQLRLLGLITKVDMGGKGKNYYRLSNAYRKEIGLPDA